MADVTINITGNSNSARNALDNIGSRGIGGVSPISSINSPINGGGGINSSTDTNVSLNTGGDTPVIPTYDRMAQDIRREMLSRGALMVPGSSNFNQLMTAVRYQTRDNAYTSIESSYAKRSESLKEKQASEERAIRNEIELKRQKELSVYNDPLYQGTVNNKWDKELSRRLKELNARYQPEFDRLDSEEVSERQKVDEQLVEIGSKLVQELRSGNPNSYLGQLRSQYREAIWRRDNSETEGEAREATTDAARIQRRMSRAMSPTNRLQQTLGIVSGITSAVGMVSRGVDAWRQNTLLQIGEINSAANGDIFGAMQQDLERRRSNTSAWGMGIGSAVGAIVGGILSALGTGGFGMAAGVGGGAAVGGGAGAAISTAIFNYANADEERMIKLGQLWQQQEQRIQQLNELALITRGSTGNDLTTERNLWLRRLNSKGIGTETNGIINFNDLGYTGTQFSSIMAQRAKQRGFFSGGNFELINENGSNTATARDLASYTAEQIALERAYNMSEGSIAQLSAYDRYGNNANQDMANLIASLKKGGVLGMSGGQTLRSNEFLGYQTQLMEMQKGWMDAPNAKYATGLLLMGQRAFGNNFDSRAINEIGQIESTVTHPKEDYSKALLYDVIQDIMPQTKGNLLAIRQAQYSDDPNVRIKIQQAMAKRIQEVYGGLDTTSGYLAASHYYGIEDPNRLRKIMGQYQQAFPSVTPGNIGKDVSALKDYTPEVSKSMLGFQDHQVLQINQQLFNLEDVGNKLITKFDEKMTELIGHFK